MRIPCVHIGGRDCRGCSGNDSWRAGSFRATADRVDAEAYDRIRAAEQQGSQVAKIQASVADHAVLINKAQFLPNIYAGSGAGYTYGIPETPGGRAPALFNHYYTEQVFNEPLRGQGKEQQEQARAQKIALEDARNSVIVRTASAYLELVKVRHSAELLQKEQGSAEKILGVVQQRAGEGFELPVEVTRAQLTKAQVAQRLLQLQGREDELEMFCAASADWLQSSTSK
jgi:outer membrane protein TolC